MSGLTLRIGGEGGEGVISCGEILTRAAARSSYNVFTYRTYPAEIRGGLSMFQLRLGTEEVLSAGFKLNVMVAFNQEAIDNYFKDLKPDGILLYDPQLGKLPEKLGKKKIFKAPLTKISEDATDSVRGKNIAAVGMLAYLLGIPMDIAATTVKIQFGKKGKKIVGSNTLALIAGYQFAAEDLDLKRLVDAPSRCSDEQNTDKLIMSGNQAVSLGTLAAGTRFCAGYPITPATPIFELLTREMPKFGGHVIQCEDEISAIGACLGASYAGEKVITPTSGPGMALMSEFINLASVAELPIVIVDVQRSGPSTGMPTKTEQGDLNYAMYGTPGEAPRVVIAPADVRECFYHTIMAFNIAERYQIPVILLSDASLAYRTQTVKKFNLKTLEVWSREEWSDVDNGYQRYAITKSGISPIAKPGTEHGYYQATGLEHDEYGHPSYSPEYHEAMQKKRYHKYERIEKDLGKNLYERNRPVGSKIGVISWGSTKGSSKEAIKMAEEYGLKVAHFHPYMLMPLPKTALKDFVRPLQKILVVEENFTGQLANLIRSEIQIDPDQLTKAQGVPFTPKEIFDAIKRLARK